MFGAQRERQAEERRAAARARREAGGSQGDWALVDAASEERVGMRTRKRASAAQERAGDAAEMRAHGSQVSLNPKPCTLKHDPHTGPGGCQRVLETCGRRALCACQAAHALRESAPHRVPRSGRACARAGCRGAFA